MQIFITLKESRQVWHVLENTSVRVLSPIVFCFQHYIHVHTLTGSVFSEPALCCVILSNKKEHVYTLVLGFIVHSRRSALILP